jgi:hypothetical protein
VLELCGLEWSAEDFSWPPWLLRSDEPANEPPPLYAGGLLTLEDRDGVVWRNRKFIRRRVTGREEVFDLASDPRETRPLVLPEEELAELRGLLQRHRDDAAKVRTRLGIAGPSTSHLDEASQRDLERLGYIK